MKDQWAIYTRYSHKEMQDSTTMIVQEEQCRAFIKSRGGECVEVFSDEAESATTVTNRTGYQRLLAAAGRKKFTHLVVLRWERFHRDATEASRCKDFLRYACKIEVYSVKEPSAHDGAAGALMEGFLDHMNAFTSAQLSVKYKDAKYNIFKRGGYLAGTRLFGYTVGNKAENYVLKVNEDERAGVVLMFDLYSTGKYSYSQIAAMMNEQGYRAVTGRKFTKHAVRTALGNHVYVGKLSYQPTAYHDKEKKHRDYSVPVETIDGVHEAIITQEIWDKVVVVRGQRDTIQHGGQRHVPFLLRGVIWCWHCYQRRGDVIGKEIKNFGRCQCRSQQITSKYKDHKKYNYTLYKCVTKEQGYECPEKPVRTEKIDAIVVDLLGKLPELIPSNWYDILTRAMARENEDKSVLDVIEELKDKKQRVIDLYEDGVIDRDTMRDKIRTIENDIEQKLPMLEADSVQEAAAFIQDFPKHFAQCKGDVDAQNVLIRKIIERVYIADGEVVAVTFKANVHLIIRDVVGFDMGDYVWMEFKPNLFGKLDKVETEETEGTQGYHQTIKGVVEKPLASMRPRRDSNSRPTV